MSTPLDRLKSIHERMQGVSEEEVLAALYTEAEPVCGNCRHWSMSGNCDLAGSDDRGRPDVPSSLAVALGPDAPAYLQTAPTFGCNQFEAKGSA